MVCGNCFVKSTVKARDFKIEFRIQTGFSSLLDCCCFDLILSIIFWQHIKKWSPTPLMGCRHHVRSDTCQVTDCRRSRVPTKQAGEQKQLVCIFRIPTVT